MASLNQPSFAAGELSPELRRRIDLQRYGIGAEVIQNMIVLPRGGVQSRPGTKFVYETKTSAKASRLVDFVFSVTQAYVLEFGHQYIRFYMDGGIIMNGASPYEVATTYTEAELPALKFEQSADTLYITHPSHAPATLTRTGHTAWTLANLDFANGPLRTENDTATTMTITNTASPTAEVIAKGTAVTLTASAATFNSGHVGGMFGIRHKQCEKHYTDECPVNTAYTSPSFPVWGEWTVVIDPRGGDFNDADAYIERSRDDGATWTRIKTISNSGTATVETSGSDAEPVLLRVTRPDVVDDSFKVSVDSVGYFEWCCVEITGYTSATVVTGTLMKNFDQGAVTFKTWAEGSWSPYRGWPACVSFYQDRLCFGNTYSEPNSFWDSKTGDYVNFDLSLPSVDDDAINSRLPGRMVNAIEWMVPLQAQVVLTTDSEWTIEPSIEGVFAPSSIQVKQQTYFGADGVIEPVIVGDMVMFVQRNGDKIRGFAYDDVNGKSTTDLSIMANHLFDGYAIADWAYQQSPNSVLWVVRSDGALLSFTYHKEHEVWAWARHDTDGDFESCCCIPGSGQDDVYFVVNRTINGSAKRYVEMLAHRNVSTLASFVGLDCSLSATRTASTAVTGLSHLEGKTVSVLADGVQVKGLTVTSGAITLPKAAATVHVGLPFTWRLKTLQIDATNKQIGYSSDKKKLIPGATISVLNSYGGQAGDEQFVDLPWGSPKTSPALESDDINVELLSGWRKEGQFELTGDAIYPMHITNLMPRVQVGGN